jgi:hypothetical protein
MAILAPVPKFRALDANGNPLAGGKLFSYQAGTNTPLVTYTDSTEAPGTENANPVVLNSAGEANVWLGAGQNYKLILKDSSEATTFWTIDNVLGALQLTPIVCESLTATTVTATSLVATSAAIKTQGFRFMADQYAGSDASVKINAAMAAAIAAGGGIVDATGLGGGQTISEQIAVGNGSVGVVLLLPANATWSVTIADGTSSALYLKNGSAIIGQNTLTGSGRVCVIQTTVSANVESLFRTDPAGAWSYFRAEGFQLYHTAGTVTTALAIVENAADNSTFSQINISQNHATSTADGLLIQKTVCGAGFYNVTVNNNHTGRRCVWLKDDTDKHNLNINFYGLSADHAGAGYANVEISGAGAALPSESVPSNINFFGLYTEDDPAATPTFGVKIVDARSVHIHGWAAGNMNSANFTALDISETAADQVRDITVSGFLLLAGGAGTVGINNHISGESLLTSTGSISYYEFGGTGAAQSSFGPIFSTNRSMVLGKYHASALDLADVVIVPSSPATKKPLSIRNFADNAMLVDVDSGSTAAQNTSIRFLDRGAAKWSLQKGSSNSFVLRDDVNSVNRLLVDGTGKATLAGSLVIDNTAAPTVAADQLGLGSTTATTVGAPGGASALPATPAGYLIVNIGGTAFKIPYYAS